MRFSVEILASHGNVCPYCKQKMFVSTQKKAQNDPRFPTRDHVIPKSVTPNSVKVIVCRKCNIDKKNNDLNEWLKILIKNNDKRAFIVKNLIDKPLIRSEFKKESYRY